jgi:hydroxyacyl-ACP dehydratase HTD2-like protein with hotdog domain
MRRLREISVGDELPTATRTPTRLTLFLFGVAYWTAHRVHYDVELARAEGFDDVLVTANLLSGYLAALTTQWAGDPGCLRTLTERNLSPAVAGDELTIRGSVIELIQETGTVRCALTVDKSDGSVVVTAEATLHLPD